VDAGDGVAGEGCCWIACDAADVAGDDVAAWASGCDGEALEFWTEDAFCAAETAQSSAPVSNAAGKVKVFFIGNLLDSNSDEGAQETPVNSQMQFPDKS